MKQLRADSKIEEINKDLDEENTDGWAERFDSLGQDLISDNWDILTNLKKKGERVSEERDYELKTKMSCFRNISSVISVLKRQNRIIDKPNENFDKQLLQKIKDKKGSMPSIVRDMNEKEVVNAK